MVSTITNFSSYRVLIAQRPCNLVTLCRDLRIYPVSQLDFFTFLNLVWMALPTLDIWSNRKEDQSLILFAKVMKMSFESSGHKCPVFTVMPVLLN
jgi:hypothetical protein